MKWKDNKYDLNKYFKCQDKLFNLKPPLIMGVLNITPNSFFEESRKPLLSDAILQANKLIDEGADIIDIGGVSTQPNAELLTAKEEISRILPILKELRKNHPKTLLSIDTFRADVAQIAVEAGADIINDVYGGRYDKNMFKTVAQLDVPYILMHSRGFANNMQDLCKYDDVVTDVCYELSLSLSQLRAMGIKDVIIDPGFGFAKDVHQNYQLFNGISFLETLDCPILIGISRKSMIYNYLNTIPSNSLNGTSILNTFSLLNNTSILRVHDVKEAVEAKQLILKIKEE